MKTLCLLWTLLLGSQVHLFSQQVLTLDQAIAIGLDNNFSIKIAQEEEAIAQNNQTLGNAGFLPTIDLSANQNYTRQNVELEILGSEGSFEVKQDWAKSDILNARAGVNWVFFDGGEMFHSFRRLGELREAGAINTRINVENTMALISEAYFRIALERARLQVLTDNLAISQSRKDFAQSRYEVGKGSKLEYLAAQVDFNTDKTALLVQEEILKNAKVDLNFLMGVAVDQDFEVDPNIVIEDELDYVAMLKTFELSNPDLLLAIKQASIAYYETKQLQARQYPVLSLAAAYNYSQSENEASQLRSSKFDGVNYGIGASWLLFDGSNRRREIQNARIIENINQVEIEELRLSLQADLQKAFNRYSKSVTLVELEIENLEVAKENESIAIDRFQLGVSSFLELREA